MIGMGMRLQNPVDGQIVLGNMGQYRIGRFRLCPSRFRIVIQNRIDDGAMLSIRLGNHMGRSERCLVKETRNAGHEEPPVSANDGAAAPDNRAGPDQCARKTGTSASRSSVSVTPPRIHSRVREWP